jgi:hypothetical protein
MMWVGMGMGGKGKGEMRGRGTEGEGKGGKWEGIRYVQILSVRKGSR